MMQYKQHLLKLLTIRNLQTSQKRWIDSSKVEEVRIPVPWGHIAGKWWGSKDVQPILALHGWQDNASTWDPLVKLIPDRYSVLAIDFPGSGFSSHYSPYQNYHFMDSVAIIQRIFLYYKFEPLSLLGHSGGSASSFVYSSVFPENVKHCFGIDFVLQAYRNEKKRAEKQGDFVDRAIAMAARDVTKSKKYTWEEAVEAWVKGTRGSVNPKTAEILMKRGVSNLPDGRVVFTRDNRLKVELIESFNPDQVESLAQRINCHVVLMKASKSPIFDMGIMHAPTILETIKKHAKSFELNIFEGRHHGHMDTPELIWPPLQRLLNMS